MRLVWRGCALGVFHVRHGTALSFLLLLTASALASPPRPDIPPHTPNAIADLNSAAGLAIVRGEWRTHGAEIVRVQHHLPGPDLKPSGAPTGTHDLEPKAFTRDFDTQWPRSNTAAAVDHDGIGGADARGVSGRHAVDIQKQFPPVVNRDAADRG